MRYSQITGITNKTFSYRMWCGTGHNCSPASNYYETSFPYPTVILRGMNELKYMGKILLSESLYFQHKDVFDSLVAKGEPRLVVDETNLADRLQSEAVTLDIISELEMEQAKLQRASDFLSSETATWETLNTYNFELTETKAEMEAYNAEIQTLLSGQTTQPAGTASQPAGTQPDKEAGLNPLIPVALALVGVAAVAVVAKVKS